MSNNSLIAARKAKNDEFYTHREDIEAELSHYKDQFKGKVVYCNCDNPSKSQFWRYFGRNFNNLGLKKLMATHYVRHEKPHLYVLETGRKADIQTISMPTLYNGDFRTLGCTKLLQEADIVVTNPPFSLFRAHVKQLLRYKKKFLVIGIMAAVGYKDLFPYMQTNEVKFGYTQPKQFTKPDGEDQTFGNIMWFTNLEKKSPDPLLLSATYKGNEDKYPVYDNIDAIEVSKLEDIPKDYYGVMGVPITFMVNFCPEQFKVVGFNRGDDGEGLSYTQNGEKTLPFTRILIKRVDKPKKVK